MSKPLARITPALVPQSRPPQQAWPCYRSQDRTQPPTPSLPLPLPPRLDTVRHLLYDTSQFLFDRIHVLDTQNLARQFRSATHSPPSTLDRTRDDRKPHAQKLAVAMQLKVPRSRSTQRPPVGLPPRHTRVPLKLLVLETKTRRRTKLVRLDDHIFT